MKIAKNLAIACIATIALGLSEGKSQINLPQASSVQKIEQGLGIGKATLTYNRPNRNDRKIFGDLVPLNEVWRTGANNIPAITFDSPVSIAGHQLPAGTYGILTIPNKTEWTIIFSKNSNQWGSYTYQESDDVLRFKVKPTKLNKMIETFTMDFSEVTTQHATLSLRWEKTEVSFGITYNQDAKIMSDIDAAMKGDQKPYLQAAQYYYANDKDIQKALEWITEAEKATPDAFYIFPWKARIQLKAGDKEGAIATAQKGIEVAEKSNNSEYVKLNKQVLAEARKK
jgi:tetratricopeptide (TPR) repeat protein